MSTVALVLFCIWLIGGAIIERRHSEQTIWSLLELKPPKFTFWGWVYLILWSVFMFFLIGLVGLIAG